jgi:hypothetical protein
MAAVAPVAHDKLDGPRYCKRNPLAQVRKPPEDASGESCESSCQVSGTVSGAGRSTCRPLMDEPCQTAEDASNESPLTEMKA